MKVTTTKFLYLQILKLMSHRKNTLLKKFYVLWMQLKIFIITVINIIINFKIIVSNKLKLREKCCT